MSEENRLSRRGFLGAAAALGAAGLIGPLGLRPGDTDRRMEDGDSRSAILDLRPAALMLVGLVRYRRAELGGERGRFALCA